MRIFQYFLLFLIPGFPVYGYESRTNLKALGETIDDMSLGELEERRETIEREIGQLARFAMNSGVGRIGYRSNTHPSEDSEEWIEIDFGKTVSLDSIALVPALWRDAQKGFIADSFPEAFCITAGIRGESEETVVFQIDSSKGIIPRVAPFLINGKAIKASWIRLTANRLSPRNFDGEYVLQLSEILVFDGYENVALGATVEVSSSISYGSGAWGEEYLVDGFVPYLMDSSEGSGTVAYVVLAETGDTPSFSIDLETPSVLEDLVLHVVEQTDTVPQAFPGDYGIPYKFLLEGSLKSDFSDPVVLLEFERDSIFDVGPIMSFSLTSVAMRYVRLRATEPYVFSYVGVNGEAIPGGRLGFAEIELYSKGGHNMALGKLMKSEFRGESPPRHIEALTDGKNLYGSILTFRDWINQLAVRHDLEKKLPLVSAELGIRYAKQKQLLFFMRISLGLLVLFVIVGVFVYRHQQQRVLFKARERITADLHDVLGGNISAIVLLSELAKGETENPKELTRFVGKIDSLAVRTRNALKYISDVLSQPNLYENLTAEMRRIATGLTDGLEHDLQISGEEFISRIHQRNRVDIFLFYKECLVNIIRHSGATKVSTRLDIDKHYLKLEVTDNGIGLDENGVPVVPTSLRRRARILGAKVSVSPVEGGGSRIHMIFKWNRIWPWGSFNLPFLFRS
ncbi:ATP-binding protein [Puniceicoccales bacterium CK1056]|uniref:histidine kinase n=1 Tax=Oceanipulchritudo coccoides TaxID=2706888 RepID=A0A6B2LZH9_9BACT|nr:histidine kinase [Oceanipulchritudo coccoides]NDV62068.1 ATP-binding protein [Oceanipulchritudo coccoides]